MAFSTMLQELLVAVAFLCLVVAVVVGILRGRRDREEVTSKDWLNNPYVFDRSLELSSPRSWSSHHPTNSGQSFQSQRGTVSTGNSDDRNTMTSLNTKEQ